MNPQKIGWSRRARRAVSTHSAPPRHRRAARSHHIRLEAAREAAPHTQRFARHHRAALHAAERERLGEGRHVVEAIQITINARLLRRSPRVDRYQRSESGARRREGIRVAHAEGRHVVEILGERGRIVGAPSGGVVSVVASRLCATETSSAETDSIVMSTTASIAPRREQDTNNPARAAASHGARRALSLPARRSASGRSLARNIIGFARPSESRRPARSKKNRRRREADRDPVQEESPVTMVSIGIRRDARRWHWEACRSGA